MKTKSTDYPMINDYVELHTYLEINHSYKMVI